MRRVVLGLVFAACTGDRRKLDGGEAIARSKALADQVCACTTAACTDPLDAQWNAITTQLQGVTLTAPEVDALAAETARYFRCVAGAPSR